MPRSSNQRIMSHINLLKFLSDSVVFHKFCLFRNEITAFRRFFSGDCVRSGTFGKPGPDPVGTLTKPGY
jgi:hypothetical protein